MFGELARQLIARDTEGEWSGTRPGEPSGDLRPVVWALRAVARAPRLWAESRMTRSFNVLSTDQKGERLPLPTFRFRLSGRTVGRASNIIWPAATVTATEFGVGPMRVDRASHIIRAQRERVFDAFTRREAVVCWLPPAGAHAVLDQFEPVPGGPFRMTLIFGGPHKSRGKTSENSDTVDGKFVEIVRPERIVQEFMFVSDDPRFAGKMLMTWTLSETSQGTLVSVAAENVPKGILPDEHQTGMASSLKNLARYIESR